MKKILFRFACKLFRCDVRHLNDVYQAELPLNPEKVRETAMYKKLMQFIKIALVFRQYDLLLEGYQHADEPTGRCIWNIFRDETKYILSEDENDIFLGKWKRGDFIEVASIQKEAV
jgi:hypothetical protein